MRLCIEISVKAVNIPHSYLIYPTNISFDQIQIFCFIWLKTSSEGEGGEEDPYKNHAIPRNFLGHNWNFLRINEQYSLKFSVETSIGRFGFNIL